MAKKPPAKGKRSAAAALAAPGHPSSLQIGALCWRRTPRGEIRVLLITSRDTGRWVIPKGWPMRRRTEAEAAAREAWEEAGARGTIASRSLGLFAYEKRLGKRHGITCVVRVYPLEVRELMRAYPETGQRRVKWFAKDRAAQRVAEPDLAAMIRDFEPDLLDPDAPKPPLEAPPPGTPPAPPDAAPSGDGPAPAAPQRDAPAEAPAGRPAAPSYGPDGAPAAR